MPELDRLTSGAFTAPTSGERAQRIRDWLVTQPSVDQLQAVFKELGARDKGAAKPLREKLDEIKRAKGQEAMAAEWAAKAEALLAASRFHIADALAWQRDAAKTGAPLSKPPLAALKVQLAERIKGIEDLQHQVLVQREAAVLMAQRIEVLSTKSWRDAQQAAAALQTDVEHWQSRASAFVQDANWSSVDVKFPPLIDASQTQLLAVWDAFSAAVAMATSAANDPAAPLPPVPVWANELRALRPAAAATAAEKPGRPAMDPAILADLRSRANTAVRESLLKLEQEMAEGHGKASAAAAAALRAALKDHSKYLDTALESSAHAAVAAAGELEGWQRWRADQLRQELVAKAESLVRPANRPAKKQKTAAPPAEAAALPKEEAGESRAETADPHEEVAEPSVEAAEPSAEAAATAQLESSPVPGALPGAEAEISDTPSVAAAVAAAGVTTLKLKAVKEVPAKDMPGKEMPVLGGRKLQESLRQLREQWKQVDQGGVPNHALWKRFDEACNLAYQAVEVWLEKVKAEESAHRAEREALIEEVKAWTLRNTQRTEPHEWKAFARAAQQFELRWRDGGHVGEKAFAQLQPLWKAAITEAYAPLEAAQKASRELRHNMIEQATALGAEPYLRIDAVRQLQQRWQAEAQAVPMERKLEQKLWESFRQPIDDAFNRKTLEREKAEAALSQRDRAVLDAAKALDIASASADAQAIQLAMANLQKALQGQLDAAAAVAAAGPEEKPPQNNLLLEISPPTAAPIGPTTAPPNEPPEASPEPLSAPPESAAVAVDTPADNAAVPAVASIDVESAGELPPPAAVVKPPPVKKIVAVRGDDRPGMKKAEPAGAGRDGKGGFGKSGSPRSGEMRPGDNRFVAADGGRGPRDDGRSARPAADRFGGRSNDRQGAPGPGERRDFRDSPRDSRNAPRGLGDSSPNMRDAPRLGDAAFKAQRDALEHAQQALKKLAVQAHGEVLSHLTHAWQQRDAGQLPAPQALGSKVTAASRNAWAEALKTEAAASAGVALLRLEMAAELPTPAAHLDERRALQLQLLTRRNDPPPAQTWPQDVAKLLTSAHDEAAARRLQNALKVLLRKSGDA